MILVKIFLVLPVLMTAVTSEKTKISIYYESLCGDSKRFFVDQFNETYGQIKDSILLDFIPYGKAYHQKLTNEWTFQCQHGADECLGNKFQACALNQKRGQDADAKFVTCVMAAPKSSDAASVQQCAEDLGYDWSTIDNCYKGDLGNELLAAYGDRTHNLNPRLSFVPTIIYDDVYDERLQQLSLVNFLSAACWKLSYPKPAACNV